MARLALLEKGVKFMRRNVDIMDKAEQFEAWYTALNPKAVVPTLVVGDDITTDTIRIVHRVDREFDGPALTPADADRAEAMERTMRDIMGLHYGVLLYSRRLDADGKSPIVQARGDFLRDQRQRHPERAALLDPRIEGNGRLQAILANPIEIARHVDAARDLVGRLDQALAAAPYVSADRYTLADAFATAALARFRLHGFAHWWADGVNVNVAAYYQRMRERASWAAAEVFESGNERDL
jgi:glutathione S-transferase